MVIGARINRFTHITKSPNNYFSRFKPAVLRDTLSIAFCQLSTTLPPTVQLSIRQVVRQGSLVGIAFAIEFLKIGFFALWVFVHGLGVSYGIFEEGFLFHFRRFFLSPAGARWAAVGNLDAPFRLFDHQWTNDPTCALKDHIRGLTPQYPDDGHVRFGFLRSANIGATAVLRRT